MAADAKRIVVTTTSTTAKTLKASRRAIKPSTASTRRFQLTLAESTDRMCPEFNYGELIGRPGREEDGQKNGTELASASAVDAFGADVDEAEDEKLKALARKYEEKYAPKPTSRANKKMEDYIDLGMGYDETDPFIDNTDAYDELVPSTLTTQYGGFYINSGKLDFKEVQSDSSDELIDPAKRKKRQRLKEMEKEARKRRRLLMKVDNSGELAPKKRGRKPMDRSALHDGALMKQKKKQETVAVLLQQRKAQQKAGGPTSSQQRHITVGSSSESDSPCPSPPSKYARVNPPPPASQSATTSSSSSPPPPPPPRNQTLQLPTVHLVPEITIINDLVGTKLKAIGAQQLQRQQQQQPNALINDIIESVILASREQRVGIGGEFSNNAALVELVSSDSDNPAVAGYAGSASGGAINPLEMETAPKLPDGLPDVLDEAIKQIKVAALKSGEGKCRFFSNEVNNMLLSIELMSRELSCSQRSTLFGHLASHLPCTKETLLKRAKKLRLDQEDVKLKELLAQLKKAIYDVMPTMEDAYKAKCLALVRGTRTSNLSDEASDSSDEYWEEDGSPSPDEDNMEMTASDGTTACVRKKFIWNDKLRTLLCDAVQIKLRCFEMSKTRTQSIDKYLRRFFDVHVKGLWPNGWMHSRKLMKESRLVHAHLTCRHRKNLILGGKKFTLPVGTQVLSTAGPSGTSGLVVPKIEPLAYDATTTGQRNASSSVASTTPPLPTPVRTLSPAVQQLTNNSNNPPSTSPLTIDLGSPPSGLSTTAAIVTSTDVIATQPPPSLKLTNHVFSLLRTDNLVGGGSSSTAEHFIGELIADQLANFPNSSTVGKHSTAGGSRSKFHDSALFTAAMIKCGTPPLATTSNSAPSSSSKAMGKRFSDEPKITFVSPSAKVPGTSSDRIKSGMDSQGQGQQALAGGVSILKQERHHSSSSSQQHRWSNSPDLRVSNIKTTSHSAGSTPTAHKNQTPIKVDMLLAAADCLGAMGATGSSSKTSAPYRSLFDIQGAIERGLQGQLANPQHSNHASTKVSSRTSSANYHQYSGDAPLNFSTSRGTANADKLIKSSSSAAPSRTSLSPTAVQNYVTLFADKSLAAPSVRTVNLPQHLQSNKKYSASVSQQRHLKSDSQDVLEGIAAAVHEQHIRKTSSSTSQRALGFVTSSHRSRATANASKANHNHNHHHYGHGGHGHHASSSSSTLSKVTTTSGYSEPTHSVHQGTKDLSAKQRYNRPTTSTSPP